MLGTSLGLRAPYRLKRWVGLLAQATLNLNFTRGGPLDSRVTFSRASGGTSFRPVSYGPNLVPNGTFDSITGWAPQGSVTATGGKLTGTTPSGSNVFASGANLFSVVAGRLYQLEYDFDTVTGHTHSIYVNNPTYDVSMNPAFVSTAGRRTHTFVAKNTGLVSLDIVGGGGSSVGTFDNITVREVTLDRAGDPIQLFNAPTNIPRFDYDPVTRQCRGLLIEEQRTNLLTQSEFANGLSDAPIRSGLLTLSSMAGYANAIAFGAGSDAWAYKQIATTNGLTYALSVIVRMDDGNAPTFATVNNGTTADNSFALVVGGAVINPTLLTVQLQPDGNYRVSGTWVSTGVVINHGIIKYATNNNRTFKVTGYQLELGAFATSYIPTTGAAATRAADTAVVATLSPWHNASAGTLFAEAVNSRVPPSDAIVRFVAALYDTTGYQNAIRLELLNGLWRNVNTVAGVSSAPSGGWPQGVVGKIAAAFGSPSNSASFNGGTPVSAGSSVPTGITKLTIGGNEAGSNMYSGHIRRVAFWPRRLSNLDLQGLTR
jgi:hypothetical protein